jgi:large subunit ribosomal protein L4
MSAVVLTVDAARKAKIDIIENGKYTQAVHEEVTALRASRRSGTASTKTKAEVNLSGAKPWRQKGTGRARAGYKSSPVWVGGGVVFGPKPRDYSKKVNRKVKRIALRKAFSERVKGGDILVIDSFEVPAPKTKVFLGLLESITPELKTLVVARQFDDQTLLASRNIQGPRLKAASNVTTEDLLRYRKIIVTNEALADLSARMTLK